MRARAGCIVPVLIGLGFAVAGAFDLWGSQRSNLREFDPAAVGHLETKMWRSYYERKPIELYGQLVEMLRTQYRLPPLRARWAAFLAARASFTFKRGKERADYQRALPDLERYYGVISRSSDRPFPVAQTAQQELEWWIVHRQRETYGTPALERTLAEVQASIYQRQPSEFTSHARDRARAMVIRDSTAAAGGVRANDWDAIDRLLVRSWTSLQETVNR